MNVKCAYSWHSSYNDSISHFVSQVYRCARHCTGHYTYQIIQSSQQLQVNTVFFPIYGWGTSQRSHGKSMGQKDWLRHRRSWLLFFFWKSKWLCDWGHIPAFNGALPSPSVFYSLSVFLEWDSRMLIQENDIKVRCHAMYKSDHILRKLCPFLISVFWQVMSNWLVWRRTTQMITWLKNKPLKKWFKLELTNKKFKQWYFCLACIV